MKTRHLATVLAAAAASVGSFASTFAFGEATSTKPATTGDGMQVQSPYWNGGGGSANSSGNNYYYEQPQYGEGLMEKTVLAVPGARADAVAAKWQFRRANSKLNSSADMLRRDFNESDEYAAAVNDLKQAYRDLENARFNALKGIRGSGEYEAIESLRKSVSGQIADERDQDQPSLDRLIALAELKMQAIAPVRAAEQQTIENDSAVKDAKTRLINAANKLAKLEKEFNHGVRDSIELADARKAKEDARIAMLASAAFLDEARIARNIAIRYSYASRGLVDAYGYATNPTSPYGHGYASYNYGYGYGGGYGYGSGFSYGGGFGAGNMTYTGAVSNGTIFGSGSNAFVGRGGNAFIGGGPGSNPAAQNPGGNVPGANSPGQPFGPNPGKDIPSPFYTGPIVPAGREPAK